MTDVHTAKIRSYNMSRIRGKNTKPEVIVRKALYSNGFRYRINTNSLVGKPDIVIKKLNTIIFIHGCFWHGHSKCKYSTIPKTNTEWWINKINTTINRDKKNIEFLKSNQWEVIVIWECELKPKNRETTINSLIKQLTKHAQKP